ncbi:MAG: hypothetical protein AAF720_04090 [Pseudomonadota bacterium]
MAIALHWMVKGGGGTPSLFYSFASAIEITLAEMFNNLGKMEKTMTYSEHGLIVDWLIVQRQMLGVWLDDIETTSSSQNNKLASKLHEHDRWLAQSIEELRTIL